jgi:prepilin-type N-terminal cleavage/methylation domain-containing protein/prepilin-type processing-associated H-X9-DG protein
MAGPRMRKGFTLVELLVVITIIGMLVSLLLPAIQAARETGRKNTCINNMRNASTALMQVHDSRRAFPGYVNMVGKKRASWVVTILNNLDRGDLYQNWLNKTPLTPPQQNMPPMGQPPIIYSTDLPWAYTQLAILLCPSNPSTGTATDPLSYAVNSGSAFTSVDNLPGNTSPISDVNSGVFFNQAATDSAMGASATNYNPTTTATPGPKVSMDFISTNDGTTYTIMLSENLQAGNWASDPTDTGPTNDQNHKNPYQSDFQVRQNTAIVWFITGALNNADVIPPTYAPMKINAQAKNAPSPLAYNAMGGDGLAYSRPSSSHPGGVNVMFCDNHYRFIAEDIQYHVYTQLMTPRQSSVIVTSSGQNAKNALWTYLINEADY